MGKWRLGDHGGITAGLEGGVQTVGIFWEFPKLWQMQAVLFHQSTQRKEPRGTVLEVLGRGGIFESQGLGTRSQCHRGKSSLEEKVPTTSDSGAKVSLGCQSKEPRATNSSTGATDGDSCWWKGSSLFTCQRLMGSFCVPSTGATEP